MSANVCSLTNFEFLCFVYHSSKFIGEALCMLSISSECSAQEQVFYCKCRNEGCSSVQRQVFHCKLRNQGCCSTVLLGINRCGSFPLLSASHSLFSIWTHLKKYYFSVSLQPRKNQDRLNDKKRALWLAKRYISTLICFLNRISLLLNQLTTQLC